jgi:hypothetical protein
MREPQAPAGISEDAAALSSDAAMRRKRMQKAGRAVGKEKLPKTRRTCLHVLE